MKRLINIFLSTALLLFSLFYSCTVGLGEAVDTEAPVLTYDYPENSAIIKGEFIIYGEVSDDTGIKNLTVNLTKIGTKETYSYEGEVNSTTGMYRCFLNTPQKEEDGSIKKDEYGRELYPIKDGRYSVKVVAVDKGGRETYRTSTVIIDNTPPVLVLTRPASKGVAEEVSKSEIDAYGRTFTISGSAYDENKMEMLVVDVYDSPSAQKPLNTIVKYDDLKQDLNIKIAIYEDESGDYEKIYDQESGGTQYFYSKIKLYDNARTYDGKTDPEGSQGNLSEVFYLNNDIHAAVLSKFDVDKIYDMKNRNYTGSVENLNKVFAVLNDENYKLNTSLFSLNPINNPVYSINGMDSVSGTLEEKIEKIVSENEITMGSSITVKMSSGLDKSPLVRNSIGIYAIPIVMDGEGKYSLDENSKIWLIKPLESKSDEIPLAETEEELEKRTLIQTSGSYDLLATIPIKIEDGFESSTLYAVGIEGYDQTDNYFVDDTEVGFYLISANSIPKLEIEGETNRYVAKGKSLSLNGLVTADSKATITLKVYDSTEDVSQEESGTLVEGVKYITIKNTSNKESWGPLEIPSDYFDQDESKSYTVKVIASAGTNAIDKQLNVFYDVEPPVLDIFEITPYVDYISRDDELVTVNGTINVKIKAIDNDKIDTSVVEPSVEITNSRGDSCLKMQSASAISSGLKLYVVTNSGNYLDKDIATIKVVFYDRAGNRSEETQSFYIDQDTDKPVINPESYYEQYFGDEEYDFTQESYPKNSQGKDCTEANVINAGNPIQAKITDDDGLNTVQVQILKKVGEEDVIKSTDTYSFETSGKNITKSYSLIYQTPEEAGAYRIFVKATDIYGTVTESNKVWFKINSGAPTVKTFYKTQAMQSPSEMFGEKIVLKDNYSFTYSATDVEQLDTPEIKVLRDDVEIDESKYVHAYDSESGSGSITFNDGEGDIDGVYTYSVSAVNSGGRKTILTRSITLDKHAPEISIVSPETGEWQNKSIVEVRGSTEDAVTGVKANYYTLNPSLVPGNGWTGWTLIEGKNNWKVKTPESTPQGETNYYFASEDVAGNVSEKYNFTLKVDLASPVISQTKWKKDTEQDYSEIKNNGSYTTNKPFVLMGTVSDTYGLKSLSLVAKKGQSEIPLIDYGQDKTELEISGTSYEWQSKNITIGSQGLLEDGEWAVSLIVTDLADKTKETDFTYVVDTISPQITTSQITYSQTSIAAKKSGDYYKDNGPTLTVTTVDETSGMDTLFYLVTNEKLYNDQDPNHTQIDVNSFESTVSGVEGTYTKKLSVNDGESFVYLLAKDNASNISFAGLGGTLNILSDVTPPQISFVKPNADSVLSGNKGCNVEITVTDDFAGFENIKGTVSLLESSTLLYSEEIDVTEIQVSQEEISAKLKTQFAREKMALIQGDHATISVSVTDGAGNEATRSEIISLDKESPTVTIVNPTSIYTTNLGNYIVNGKLKIDGTAKDNGDLNSLDLYRLAFEGETENVIEITVAEEQKQVVLLQHFEANKAYAWEYSDGNNPVYMDVTSYDGKQITFIAVAKDAAENVGYAEKTVYVDQDSDRPIVKFSNLVFTNEMSDQNRVWITKEQIYGAVKDDDGIESIKIAFGEPQSESDWEEIYEPETDTWTYNFPLNGSKDGPNVIYFKVKDTENATPFVSSISNTLDLHAPKLNYKSVTFGSDVGKYSTVLYSKIDSQNPSIPVVYYSTDSKYDTYDEEALVALLDESEHIKAAFASDWKELATLASNLGGDTDTLFVLVKGKDSNGISQIEAMFADDDTNVSVVAEHVEEGVGNRLILLKINLGANEYKDMQGKNNLVIKVTDNANRYTSLSYDVILDNKAPEITIITPSSKTASWYGSTVQNITGQVDDYTKAQKFYFGVSKNSVTEPASYSEDLGQVISLAMWQLTFDGNLENNTETQYHTELLNDWIKSLYGESALEENDEYPLCIWMYGVDSLGNSGKNTPEKVEFTVFTQGDKPTVTVMQPKADASLGGAITITGTTTIATNEVDSIYIQIDPDYDGEFNDDWADTVSALIHDKAVSYEITDTGITGIGQAIKANGSSQSWYLIINDSSEFNKAESNTNIAIRVYAVSKTNKVSEPVIIPFIIDPNTPVFGDKEALTLVQYQDNVNGTGNIVSSQLFTNDLWIKGKWWIVGSVYDEQGVEYVDFYEYYDASHTQQKSKIHLVPEESVSPSGNYLLRVNEDDKELYCRLHVAVGNETPDEYGTLYYVAVAKEKVGSKTLPASFTMNFDNKAPVFGVSTFTEDSVNSIVQSDGVFEMKGLYSDVGTSSSNQSGFERIAFYFKRSYKGNNYITDFMTVQGDTIADNSFAFSELKSTTPEDGLYWLSYECKIDNNIEIILPDSLETVPSVIRAGSLCKINSVIYRIYKVEGKTVTIENRVSNADSVTVDFAIAQVIDIKIKEVGKTTYFGDDVQKIINDDGDYMVESFMESTGEWTVNINSKNILDGLGQMVFVAYDKAGNMTDIQDYTFDCKVANNAPRIAGIKFGTDRNGSGQVENQELISSYSGLYAHGQTSQGRVAKFAVPCDLEGDTSVIQGNSVLTIKGETKIVPEIVGGNESLGWSYDVGTNQAAVQNAALPGSSGVTQFEGAGHAYDENVRDTEITTINLSIKDLLNKKDIAGSSLSDGEKVFRFIIWDYTEGTEIGTESSNHAEIYLKANLAIRDSVAPVTGINPFYWNQAGEGNSSVMFDNKVPLGHIEVEKDLSFTGSQFKASNEGVSGKEIFDLDPKVSGVIYLEGFARDNVNISKVYIKIPELEGFDDYVPFIQRQSNGTWTCPYSLETDGIALAQDVQDITDEDEYNVVSWKIAFDTSKLTGGVKADLVVKVKAEDFGKAVLDENNPKGFSYQNPMSSVDSNVQTTKETKTCRYKMDVVPYIYKVITRLSSLKSNNPSVYSRTARGHYSISAEETEVVLSGFNLSSTGEKTMTLDASAIASSGDWELVLTDTEDITIKSLNNYNNNDAKGDYTGTVDLSNNPTGDYDTYKNYYNRAPNGDNNNLLTDDVTLDIWQVNSQAGKPTNGTLTQPVMAINPVNKQVGFAFVNGPLNFSMGTSDKSYTKWKHGIDFWTSIGFAYDANGNSYGTAAGGDINGSTDADPFGIFSSKWGDGGTDNSQNHHNTAQGWLRLESIGQGEATDAAGKTFTGDNINKERIKSSSIATTVIDETNTNVYLAYYDELNNEIRFKYGKVSTTKGNDGLLADYYGPNGSLRNTKSVQALPYTLEYTSLIAGQTEDKKTFYYDNKGKQQYVTISTAVMTDEEIPQKVCAGQYVSIAAKYQGGDTYNTGTEESPVMFTDDLVVAVWYDATNNQMLYSYNTAPHKIKALTYKGTDRTIDSYSQSATGWSTPVAIFGEGNGIGEYCKVAMDANGKVHVACYDNSNGDVWYAYIDDYSAPSSARTCIVDSYGIVGTEIGLDVAIKDGNPVPYISYYGSSCARPKVAYWAGTESIASATSLEGAVAEVSSGLWEISLVPTKSKISIDHINVGVWKNSSGVLNYSTLDGNAPGQSNVGVCNAGTDNGMVYGNGTMNPILGYAITQGAGGFIETAQIK